MRYTTRILPVEEWPRLDVAGLADVWPTLSPENTQVIVVEHGDQIVGAWLALRIVHAEGVWVDPAHRGFAVTTRLLAGMRNAAAAWGCEAVWTGAQDAHVRGLIEKLGGTPIPIESFHLPMGRA